MNSSFILKTRKILSEKYSQGFQHKKDRFRFKKIAYKTIYIHKYELKVLLCEKYPQGFSHVGKTDSDLKIYRFVVR